MPDTEKFKINDGPCGHEDLAAALFGKGRCVYFRVVHHDNSHRYYKFYITAIRIGGGINIIEDERYYFNIEAACFEQQKGSDADQRIDVMIDYYPDTRQGTLYIKK